MNVQSRNVLNELRQQYQCHYSIADLTPTICHLFGIPEPEECGGIVIPEAADQAHLAAVRFEALKEEMDPSWKNYNHALIFVPDHGGHPTDETHGGHGSDQPDDMIVSHYYRISEKQG